ncbi:MAG: hypothetical protein A2234_01215 [Elusimicrobia bacterium RIFOXYA2_FULL_58_8]|nr:MAG: hypothetical protein A2285_09165 [Elusimicrobia bacterium RIFOXYA12_FULL_57_11]OGS16950.1 MAG: hypothetical protein A2234_01215 [Elusimicrobia bacterium RIFOXYA2_FULL_58_8]
MRKIFISIFIACALAAGNGAAAEPAAGKFYTAGDPEKAEFALTFDDGPGQITAALLKLLEGRGAKATFFMPGSSVRAKPEMVKNILAAGHLVASHTDLHKNWFKIGASPGREAVLAGEIKSAEDAFYRAIGVRPAILRMPNGYDRPWVRRVAAQAGCNLVNWTFGEDWLKMSEEKMTVAYLKALKPGAILLLHDGGGRNKEKNLRIVEALLAEASKKGLRPVRLDEMLGIRAVKEGAVR